MDLMDRRRMLMSIAILTPIETLSGTITLSSSSSTISVDFGQSFDPDFVIIQMAEPEYSVNGCIGATYLRTISSINLGGDKLNYQYTQFETRSMWDGFASIFANSGGTPTFSSNGIVFKCRNNGYQFFAGDYEWYAVKYLDRNN